MSNLNEMNFLVHVLDLEEHLRVKFVYMPPKAAGYYGNGSHVSVYVNEELYELLDTRYEKGLGTLEGYRKKMTQWVIDQWEHDDQTVEQIS